MAPEAIVQQWQASHLAAKFGADESKWQTEGQISKWIPGEMFNAPSKVLERRGCPLVLRQRKRHHRGEALRGANPRKSRTHLNRG
jgi:hypothetical protein